MRLTKKQEEGLKIIKHRYDSGEAFVTIAGFAGTGKTFLVRRAIEMLGLDSESYRMATFTGKAALVLRQQGFPAITLHKLLYKSIPVEEEPGKFIHIPRKEGEGLEGVKVIVIDEISMVPDHILRQAVKHKIFIIALGDPFQLPPIGRDNGLLHSPHIFLDEIMRQGEGSSIIELSQLVRNFDGKRIEAFSDDTVQIIHPSQVVDGMLHWADQILCSTNQTRQHLNAFVRGQKGMTSQLPQEGEKIIFTRNNWERVNAEGYALVNGMIGTASNIALGEDNGLAGQEMSMDVEVDFSDIPFFGVRVDANPFKGLEDSPRTSKKDNFLESADFGYAITVHKSQGSEFDNVLLYEEAIRKDLDLKLLYTAITRASKKLVIVPSLVKSKFRFT